MGKDIKGIPVLQDERLIRLIADIHKVKSSQKVCFIIGAGASISSGIRSGERLSTEWLKEIKECILDEVDYKTWVTEKKINEDYPGENYSDIYIQRFEDSKEIGYDFINHEMQGKEPNIGYLLLGELLNYKEQNIVIATNFDNLIERSLYTYQSVEPLVCAHENMAVYARPADGRPLIAKIHRDKLFDPINDPDGVNNLDKNWIEPLIELFSDKIVVCIGYGGNDGSLMKLLNQINPPKGLYWCILPNATPPKKVSMLKLLGLMSLFLNCGVK